MIYRVIDDWSIKLTDRNAHLELTDHTNPDSPVLISRIAIDDLYRGKARVPYGTVEQEWAIQECRLAGILVANTAVGRHRRAMYLTGPWHLSHRLRVDRNPDGYRVVDTSTIPETMVLTATGGDGQQLLEYAAIGALSAGYDPIGYQVRHGRTILVERDTVLTTVANRSMFRDARIMLPMAVTCFLLGTVATMLCPLSSPGVRAMILSLMIIMDSVIVATAITYCVIHPRSGKSTWTCPVCEEHGVLYTSTYGYPVRRKDVEADHARLFHR